jgi:sugar (pentulose or hexulose) kinase
MATEIGFAYSWVDLNDPRFLKAGEMPEKILAFLQETGQTIKPGIGFIIRVVLESLAFSYRNTIKEIERVSGNKIEILHAVGGGIQNDLLTQLTADAIGLNVLAGPIEGTIIGNIGVQSIASGSVPDIHAWRKIVANSFELKIYEPKESSYFDENEQNYNNILK